ncbi:MAG: DUF6268 family outer membrane beta-barrel protein [Verrucomicrobiota bacterium]
MSLLFAAASPLSAQVGQQGDPFAFDDPQIRDEISAPEAAPVAQEFSLSVSYVGDMEMEQGDASFGDVDTIHNQLTYVVSPTIEDGVLLRLGVDWNRFSFGLPNQAPIPNTLQNYNLIVGFDMALSDKWLMRFEALPGIYNTNTDIQSNDVNVPLVLGFSYLHSAELQFVLGLSMDLWREYPVLPGAGVRWQFAEKWTLNAIVPRPQLEYSVTRNLQLFIGAELVGGTFRSDENFGNTHGNAKLNDTPISYSEIRTGGGLIYNFTPQMSLKLSGGWVPYRRIDFHRANTQFDKADAGAPYGQLSFQASF